ncbi:hypothetical protein Gohar_026370 [Gossypium harknessii]|uniref:Uncharacterized protein n=1 Tax=Gossypium harknessii TaxID=34285 RepID=A0A7J9HRC4_9ROSI|nr:hypothetical protein [Gossypium harknessii]
MAVSDPTHQYLLQCLTQSIPTDIATSIIISKSNPPYTSVLRAYTRNARFNTSSPPKPVIIITPFPPPLFVPKSLGFNSKFVAAAMITKGYLMFLINPYLFSICLNLRSVSVNMADETAWVDAGATLAMLDGLLVGHVVDAKLVDVNGKILDRKTMGEDLFGL